MSHTPGPWVVDPTENENARMVWFGAEEGLSYALVYGGPNRENDANLIAAAPLLLELATAIVIAIDAHTTPDGQDYYPELVMEALSGWLPKARQAIKSAKGE